MGKKKSFELQKINGKYFFQWNIVSLILLILAGCYIGWVTSLGAPMRIRELEQAGVWNENNEKKLQEEFPNLAESPRYGVGEWIAEKERKGAFYAIGLGIFIVLINLLLTCVLRYEIRKQNSLLSEMMDGESQSIPQDT